MSVDGTFKSITKNWAQLFIIMCEHQGVHIPVAMAWLPDKTTLSYYTTLFLLLYTFRQHSEAIQMQCGSSNLKLKRIRCDYEEAIHLGFGRFHLSGCFFHYSQVSRFDIQYIVISSIHLSIRQYGEKYKNSGWLELSHWTRK